MKMQAVVAQIGGLENENSNFKTERRRNVLAVSHN